MQRANSLLLPLLLFATGFAVGAWFSPDRRTATATAARAGQAGEAASTAPVALPGGARAFPTDDEMLTAIMTAVVEKEPLLRAHRLHDLLGHLGSAELGALFARSVQVSEPRQRDELLATVLTRWFAV